MSDAPPFQLPVHPDAGRRLADLQLGEDRENGEELHDNAVRAQNAVVVLQAYAKRVGPKDAPAEMVVVQVMSDVRHACAALGLDFFALVEKSGEHYVREIRGVV